jgi:hypothetical protein
VCKVVLLTLGNSRTEVEIMNRLSFRRRLSSQMMECYDFDEQKLVERYEKCLLKNGKRLKYIDKDVRNQTYWIFLKDLRWHMFYKKVDFSFQIELSHVGHPECGYEFL